MSSRPVSVLVLALTLAWAGPRAADWVPTAAAQDGPPKDGPAEPASADPASAEEGPTPKEPAAAPKPRPGPLGIGDVLSAAVLVRPLAVPATAGETPSPPDAVPLSSLAREGAPLVVVFWSPGCPVARRYAPLFHAYLRPAEEKPGARAEVRGPQGDRPVPLPLRALAAKASIVVICPNATESDADVRSGADRARLPGSPYRDPAQSAVRKLGVRVTPTFLVFDADRVLRYRGPLDDNRRAKEDAEPSEHLAEALVSVLAGGEVEEPEIRSFGSAVRRADRE